jgi:hypothetical protein
LILRCLIEGGSNKSIARKNDIAEATVKVHVKAILRKIRVHNRTQAAIWGMNNGWQPQTTTPLAPELPPCATKRLPSAVGASSEQGAAAIPPGMIEHEANNTHVPGLDRLIGKDADLKSESTTRQRK